jgi:branched-chain amino acid transport system permease protein
MGTIFGPVVGAFVIVGMQNYLAEAGEWVLVIQGVIFVVVVLAFRRGIVGELAPRLARLVRSGDQATDTSQAARLTSDAR